MRAILASALLALAACGSTPDLSIPDGGNPPGSDLSVQQPTPDLSPPPDLAGVFVCGNVICGAGTTCCVGSTGNGLTASCAATCPSMTVPVDCRVPENCGGNPCCLTLNMNAPQSVMCESTPSGCPGNLTFGGNTISGTTRLCTKSADCTASDNNTNYPDCCSTTQMGVTQQFCFSSGIAALSGGAITCP